MLPPGGGTNSVDPRFLSLYSTFTLLSPPNEILEVIYSSILKAYVESFPEEIKALVKKITVGTLFLYK